jgi:hypothetical protein
VRVASVERLGEFSARITFVRGDDQIDKRVRPSSHPEDLRYAIEMKAREANRDFIIREVGTADRSHPDWDKRFPDLAAEIAAQI